MIDFGAEADAIQAELVDVRRALHQIPEVGLDLPQTQQRVLVELAGLPLEITLGRRTTSVTAVLRGGGPGPTVLLRGDMDGLPIREESGEPFASTNGNMHACGHDFHISALIGAARILSAHQAEIPGTVVFMFQPGEEGHGGAAAMVAEGVLDVTGERPVAAFATHVMSHGKPGVVVTRPGAIMAGCSEFSVTVHGRGGHGSQPNFTIDPVPVVAEIVLAVQSYVTRRVNTFDPVVVSVTKLSGSSAINVIPDTASLGATVRTLSAHTFEQLSTELPELARRIAAAHGATAEVRFDVACPVTWNDPAATEGAVAAIRAAFGEDSVEIAAEPRMGAEDFSYVVDEVPGTFVIVQACPEDLVDVTSGPTNHSPTVRFSESVLGREAAVLALLGYSALVSAAARATIPAVEPSSESAEPRG